MRITLWLLIRCCICYLKFWIKYFHNYYWQRAFALIIATRNWLLHFTGNSRISILYRRQLRRVKFLRPPLTPEKRFAFGHVSSGKTDVHVTRINDDERTKQSVGGERLFRSVGEKCSFVILVKSLLSLIRVTVTPCWRAPLRQRFRRCLGARHRN